MNNVEKSPSVVLATVLFLWEPADYLAETDYPGPKRPTHDRSHPFVRGGSHAICIFFLSCSSHKCRCKLPSFTRTEPSGGGVCSSEHARRTGTFKSVFVTVIGIFFFVFLFFDNTFRGKQALARTRRSGIEIVFLAQNQAVKFVAQ